MPAVPSSVPAQPRGVSASPPGSTASISAIMMGIDETTSEAKPEGTIFSPHVSSMLLADMKSRPTTMSFHGSPAGTRRLLPRARQMPKMSSAEMSERVPETTGADMCSPATWMAR